jgi:hypothetical protein
MITNEELLVTLRCAAHALRSQRSLGDLQLTLGHIVNSAVETVPGVVAGGISLTGGSVIWAGDPPHAAVTELEALQSCLQEGPSITAIRAAPTDGVVVAQDLAGADGDRWPEFAPKAVEAGYPAMMSTQLSTDGGLRAALNLYADKPHIFNAEAQLIAGLIGIQAEMLLCGAEEAQHLNRAIKSRDLIGQAKGILMERFGIDPDEAFQMLVRSSQQTNLKLVDVAQWLRSRAPSQRARAGVPVTACEPHVGPEAVPAMCCHGRERPR